MSQGVKRRRSSRISGTGYYAKRNKSPAPPTNILSLEHYQQMAEYVRDKTGLSPEVGVVCGSGLGGLSDLVQDPTVIPYDEVPHMPVSTVAGHEGMFVIGRLGGKTVICMKGRVHHYEGYHSQQLTAPIRLMSLLGVQFLVITNAAGGINKSYNAGDIMLIEDHINFLGLAGINPLIGPNLDSFGTGDRFPPMVNCYDTEMRETAVSLASKHGLSLQQGVYAFIGGPSFETPAEIRFLSLIGADAVGMSTAPEVIVAKHCGIKTVGFSLITNMSIHTECQPDEGISHSAVLQQGKETTKKIEEFITELVGSFKAKARNEPLLNAQEADVFHDTQMETQPNNNMTHKESNNNNNNDDDDTNHDSEDTDNSVPEDQAI